MSVAIRLRRAGGKRKPFFHIVATDSRNARDGKFIEKLGHYSPAVKPTVFKIDRERFDYWLSVGAKASPTVTQLVARSATDSAKGAVKDTKDGKPTPAA
ncbi:MAG TPA: 30S ribosomal protein S16 [Myxococcota bacterium]|nr:30S ribosomal protein S16 [Myxococcota bacterium]